MLVTWLYLSKHEKRLNNILGKTSILITKRVLIVQNLKFQFATLLQDWRTVYNLQVIQFSTSSLNSHIAMYEVLPPYPTTLLGVKTSNTHPTQGSPIHGTSVDPAEAPLNTEDVETSLGTSVEIPILPHIQAVR